MEFGPQGGRPGRAQDMCSRFCPDPLGIVLWFDKLGICRGEHAPRTTLSFRTSAHTGVGISIEFQIIHRHTDCSILPFPGIHPREIVRLFRRLPRQCALLYRNDREFAKFLFVNLLRKDNSKIHTFLKPPRSGTLSDIS